MSLAMVMEEIDRKAEEAREVLDLAAKHRRLKLLRFPTWAFHGLFAGTGRIVQGIPKDSRIEAVHYSPEDDCFLFRVVHPSFDSVPECHRIPDDLNLTVSAVT